ncbi:MAG TPA: NADH-quinone oxidoreductase subunit C [Terriglobia bacterium]|nr:NADH-quinone oxidoreductase subunit C [Terriglobia bacterium]
MPSDPESNPAIQKLRQFAPDAVEDVSTFRDEISVHIRAIQLRHICEFLRDEPGVAFKYLSDITAVDHYPAEPRFETICHILSIDTNQRLRLKVRIPGEDPRVDSMVPVWPSAQAFECEIFDLFGIQFTGHPDLRRILLPEDWEGHPLRKDYPVQGSITRWP